MPFEVVLRIIFNLEELVDLLLEAHFVLFFLFLPLLLLGSQLGLRLFLVVRVVYVDHKVFVHVLDGVRNQLLLPFLLLVFAHRPIDCISFFLFLLLLQLSLNFFLRLLLLELCF